MCLPATRDDFWNTKPPSEWNAGEIYTLMNRSPWANAVQAWNPIQEMAYLRRAEMKNTGAPRGVGPKGVVTWESAQPIRDAMKTATPPEFENSYVLGVDGIPAGGRSADTLRESAVLNFTGKPRWTVGATNARELIRATGVVYEFAFSKSATPIARNSGDIVFEVSFGDWKIRTTFEPKNMLYQGRLAL